MSFKVFVVPILLALFSKVISQNVIYISPSAETPCPVSACFTLAECAQNVTMCFVSNTTLRLLQGTHTLEAIVTVKDVTNLALIGDSNSLPKVTTEIRFNGVASLWFEIVSDVQICALSFSNSTIFLSEAWLFIISDCIFQHSRYTALSVLNATAYFERVTFSNNYDGGMVAYDSTLIFSGGNLFVNNSARKTGGGLSVNNCDVTFTGWSSFTNNSAGTGGGGMYSSYSSLKFNGIVTFTHNIACKCGGGFIASHSRVTFTSITTFSYNSADSGGGIASYNSGLNFSGISTFTLNKAVDFEGSGGGIASYNSGLNFSGISTFTLNKADIFGGAFYTVYGRVMFSSNTSFFNNSAFLFGGGFSCHSANVNFTGVNTFINNSAASGGGIEASDSYLVFSDKNVFTQNTAESNGGVFSCRSTKMNFTGVNTFINNSAMSSGGGIEARNSCLVFSGKNVFTQNTANYDGGVFYCHSTNVNFTGVNTFINNSAMSSGGGIKASDSCLVFSGKNVFTQNTANYDGGVFSCHSTNVNFTGVNTFINNSAMSSGGGIGASDSCLVFSGKNVFTQNTANYDGGVFSCHSTNVNFTGVNTFINNSAMSSGGGIGASDSCLVFSGKNVFTQNTANYDGGVFSCGSTNVDFTGVKTFINISKMGSGGGIKTSDSCLVFSGKSVFTQNTARYAGGVFSCHSTNVNFTGLNTFIKNSASTGGGIDASYSYLVFSGKNVFTQNTAKYGGGFSCQSTNVNFTGVNTFINNSAMNNGGGIETRDSCLVFSGKNVFTQNTAKYGGVFYCQSTNVNFNAFKNNSAMESGGGNETSDSCLVFSGKTVFTQNTAKYGGGFYCYSMNLNFTGVNTFINNSAMDSGGGIDASDCCLVFSGKNVFTQNTAAFGGAISSSNNGGVCVVYSHSSLIFNRNIMFSNNSAVQYGSGHAIFGRSDVLFNKNNTLLNNSAANGGGRFATICSLIFHGVTVFANNSVEEAGGGLSINNCSAVFRGNNSFVGNLAKGSGGGVTASLDSKLEFGGSTSFMDNSAGSYGGGIWAENSYAVFRGSSRFINNSAGGAGGAVFPVGSFLTFIGTASFKENFAKLYGGAIFCIKFFQPFGFVRSAVKFNGTVEFVENVAGNGGGALALWNYTVVFIGRCTFSHNRARSGGALIGSIPKCYFFSNTSVHFENNLAVDRGGAIDHLDDPFYKCMQLKLTLPIPCFFRIHPQIELAFTNNTAGEAGDSLYGGAIDSCLTYSIDGTPLGYGMFDSFSTITDNSTTSSVSSDPFRVCVCINNHPDFSIFSIKHETYPGATFLISAVAVGQRNGTVPAVIRAEIGMKSHARIDALQKAQEIEQHCSILHYTVYSPAALEEVSLNLYAAGPCSRLGDPLTVFVKLHKCPAGFVLSESKNACVCEERLLKYTSSCNITDTTIERSGNFWVGYSNSSTGLILHPHCPFDYCTRETIRFTLEDSDKQCRYNRTGLLCGACKPGLSFALATSECMRCSNSHLSLLLAFALAGVVLVIFLFVCKLNVSVGTLNGLILYTNIVAVNHSTFFPNGDTNILTVFIAWMNLDVGIKTCLYDGMDAYARTWLQFVFPVYIWTLVGIIIIASYYSTKIAKMLTGTNPVSVLATLFLLSYAKLLRAIIAVLSFTSLEYPNNSSVTVWLSDGNIEYFHGKHIPLAIVALVVFLLLLLPFTLLLMFGQWIQANSTRRIFSWACDPRVTAVLDAYHAPFNKDTRYWIGLLLLLRCALFLVFACNVLGDPSLNLLAICASMLGLEAVMKFIGDIYKNRYLDILGSSFILNLGILSIGTYQVELGGGSQMALSCISVGMAFATFIGITLYHVLLQLKGSRLWNTLQYYFEQERRWVAIPTEDTTEESRHNSGVAPTVSFINFREPLELISSTSN